ncbi:toxin-antitoxin system YwqK family antitoxin [Streptomyces sp. NPDC056230]|uniref:toxin-antitoxin system YwqK family antitoxin n=1 Tax=Streptomyces sp. NPDC056230 TaxID=3345754 RepID=UPI0035D7940A
MTDESTLALMERVRAANWSGDWDPFEHAQSRRLLMHEYLRRSALWAQAYGAEDDWPFFDVTHYIDKEFRLPPALATELDEYLKKVAYSARKTCGVAVRLAELRARGDIAMPDLPDLYEPLLLFYERGGEFLQDGAGFLDLTGVSIKPRGFRHHLVDLPFLTLDRRTLDALDSKGRISYYAPADRSGLVVRRRRELFTGAVEERLGGAVVSLDSYVAGVQHGPSREWYEDGTLRSEATAREGRPAGVSKEWHPNGVLAAEVVFSENGTSVLAGRRWDEEGRLTKNWQARNG